MNRRDIINTQRSPLALLRGLVPKRALSYGESLRIAELQANRLLELSFVWTDAVPDEIVTDLPRIRVERQSWLPVSGAAHWNGHYWVITLNAGEPRLRQRFSLMHEFKHVLDHTTRDFLYQGGPAGSAHDQAERSADYFAACLLMPKRVVKRLWCSGNQDIAELARSLRVSPLAARYRLQHLGLLEQTSRCAHPTPARRRPAASRQSDAAKSYQYSSRS